MKVLYGKKFKKQYKKSPQHIRKQFNEKLNLFQKDPFSKTLKNHTLNRRLLGRRALSIVVSPLR